MVDVLDANTPARKVKVGIVPCNGEAICEGTMTRFACRKVLDQLRPGQTVTICLPLFIAGDKAEQDFATKFPTITLDGCDKRCSAISTEKHSGKPAYSLVVTDILKDHDLEVSGSRAHPGEAELAAIDVIAEEIVARVDEIIAGKED